ncbi:hypothetical protein CTI12_AA485240 [Artemisia annua]|uniref:AT-hook motif nuclear-localized protein n=1 Tax=Artemisia annua TaxID=35608 RepID=A0A2U1LIJ6_ARTAN|nr:hypothetical protein CTI12_AA485240 [Artemisia annua]
MQPRFPYGSGGDQFSSGDGSLQSGGFLGSGYSLEPAKKKRGRPRKYSPVGDGGNVALGLSPGPNVAVSGVGGGNLERRPAGFAKRQLDALGAAGVGFTPHVIIVKAGEDIASTLMSFSQQGPRTVCILSANGSICNVTLRQPASSGGTVTYEGRFEIISLSGSFMQSEESNGNGNHSKPTGLSVSLAGSDGRVLGGGVAGMLVAASPVQVVEGRPCCGFKVVGHGFGYEGRPDDLGRVVIRVVIWDSLSYGCKDMNFQCGCWILGSELK